LPIPQHPYTRKLIDSRPVRDVHEAVVARQTPVMQADGLRVGYPVPIKRRARLVPARRIRGRAGGQLHGVAPGRTLGVIGESGSGKSTLALAALGLMPFQRHKLEVTGQAWGRDAAANKACAARCRWCSRTRSRPCRRA
jgi:microcin C transport system ATP-binding protein